MERDVDRLTPLRDMREGLAHAHIVKRGVGGVELQARGRPAGDILNDGEALVRIGPVDSRHIVDRIGSPGQQRAIANRVVFQEFPDNAVDIGWPLMFGGGRGGVVIGVALQDHVLAVVPFLDIERTRSDRLLAGRLWPERKCGRRQDAEEVSGQHSQDRLVGTAEIDP